MIHQARSGDVSQIPTNPFQQQMLAVIYVIAAVAYIAYGLRMYSRISTKQTGLGKHECSIFNFRLLQIMVLTIGQSLRGLVDHCRHGMLKNFAQALRFTMLKLLAGFLPGIHVCRILLFVHPVVAHMNEI